MTQPQRAAVSVAAILGFVGLAFVVNARLSRMGIELQSFAPPAQDMGKPMSSFLPPAEDDAPIAALPVLAPAMPEFVGIEAWLNSPPLTAAGLKGKVVLVDFWTYSCINCIRTLPYITSWDEKYRDKGLVIVGVHTPEFAFEKNRKNVEAALKRHAIRYPVAQDNSFATWNAYSNQYWPAKYLFDAEGRLRNYHFGEGEYVETERAIQSLLAEAGAKADMAVSKFSITLW